jgi:hypothetical protein
MAKGQSLSKPKATSLEWNRIYLPMRSRGKLQKDVSQQGAWAAVIQSVKVWQNATMDPLWLL